MGRVPEGDIVMAAQSDHSGKPAVPFELPDTTRRRLQLADYAGKWLLLVFHRHLA